MRVLITGANGLVGSHLARLLENHQDIELYLTSKGEKRHNWGGNEYLACDLREINGVTRVLKWAEPDVVVHTAAESHVDRCAEDPEGAMSVNVRAVKNILSRLNEEKTHFVHLSSDFVFSGKSKDSLNELEQREPVNFYGKTKVMSEDLLMTYPLATIVRTVLVYGYTPWSNRGNFVEWVRSSLAKGDNIDVVDDQIRTPTWVGDLVWALAEIVQNKHLGLYHISGKEEVNIYDFASRIASFYGLPQGQISRVKSAGLSNQKDPRPARTVFDISRAETVLGYNAKGIDSGLVAFEEMKTSFSGKG